MKTALATISAAVSLVLLFSGEALADSVEDKLDRAGDAYEAAEAKAALDFRNAFVGQIKALTKSRNFDAVQQLRAEQAAFDSFSLVLPPNDTVMRAAVGRYQAATVAAEAELRVAYESAAKRYSIEHGLDQRFVPEDDYEGIQPPPDPILDKPDVAGSHLRDILSQARAGLIAVVDAKAKVAESRGDMDGYRHFMGVLVDMTATGVVSNDVKDPDIRCANERLLQAAHAACAERYVFCRGTVFELIKARRVDAAVAVREELAERADVEVVWAF